MSDFSTRIAAAFDPPTVSPEGPVLRRSDLLFVALWAAFLVVVSFAPLLYGHTSADEGWQFTGFHTPGLNDYQGYVAWMRQAQDGHLLFVDRYTTEPHHRVSFHPLFWLVGAVSGVTGVSILSLWYVLQAFCLAFMVYAIYRFSAEFTHSQPVRVLATVWASTASGLGWLFPNRDASSVIEQPIDLWLEEANQFRAVCSSFFTLTLALGLMFMAVVWMLRYYRSHQLRDAAIAGLLALALATVHPYDLLTLYAVLGVWTLMAGRCSWPGLIVLVAISSPFLAYGFLAVRLDPVLSKITLWMEMPPVAAYIIGWGLPLALAVLAFLLPAVWRGNRRVLLLLVWVVVNLLLLLAPVDFRRKLAWGLHAIFCLLAAMSLRAIFAWLTAPLIDRPRWRMAIAGGVTAVLTALTAFGSLQFFISQFQDRSVGRYLPDEVVEAFAVVDDLTEEDDVILAGPALAGFVPGWTGATSFWGHWALTVDLAEKRELAIRLTTPGRLVGRADAARVLREHRIRYILLDSLSAAMGPGKTWPVDLERLPVAPFVQPVHSDGAVVVLEVLEETLGS